MDRGLKASAQMLSTYWAEVKPWGERGILRGCLELGRELQEQPAGAS
jgi:hypothetical protein